MSTLSLPVQSISEVKSTHRVHATSVKSRLEAEGGTGQVVLWKLERLRSELRRQRRERKP